MGNLRRALGNDEHGTLRLVGGVVFAIGALVLLIRRTTFADPWGEGAIFVVLAIPALMLYGGGVLGARENTRPSAWQAAFTVFGLLLIPAALFAFVDWIGGNDSSLNSAWILALSGVLGFVAGLGARVRYCCLIGGLLFAGAWIFLWDSILDGGLEAHLTTTRWLLVVVGFVLLAAAGAVAMRQSDDSSADVVTAAGVALVVAGGLSGFAALSAGPLIALTPLNSSLFWDLELLVVSVGLLAHGVAAGTRGTTYVGAFGLIAFIGQVGLDLDDKSPSGAVVGWPLFLLAVGALALVASIAPALRRRM